MNTERIYKLACDYWLKPSFVEKNFVGEDATYSPCQVTSNNRRKGGLLCYDGGYRQGWLDAMNRKEIDLDEWRERIKKEREARGMK